MKRISLGILVLAIACAATATLVSAQAAPEFKLGFKALADQIPQVVGLPVENEHYGANGDSLQQTSKGLMVWRKADNWTAFTNGSWTWINGPVGLQSRSNTERFDWENAALATDTGGGTTQEETLRGLIDLVASAWDTLCSFQTCTAWSNTLLQGAYQVISRIGTVLNLANAMPQSVQVGADLDDLNNAIKQYGKDSTQARDAADKLYPHLQDLHRSLVSTVPGLILVFPVPDRPTRVPAQPTNVPPGGGSNLVSNPSFEVGQPAGEVAGPAGWIRVKSMEGRTRCDAIWESTVARSGARSVSASGPSSYPGRSIDLCWHAYQGLQLDPTRRYRLSVWAKADASSDPTSGQFRIYAVPHDGAGQLVGTPLGWTGFSASQEWQQFGNDIQLPAGAISVNIDIGYMSNTMADRNKIYFDDVSLSLIP